MSDHPSGPALVRVVLERLGAGHSYDGGVNGTCYQCPFASGPLDSNGHPARWEEISNDPTEAYFRCHLPGRPNEVEWGEYAPCSQDEWVKAGLEALGGALGIGDCVRFDDGTASRELVVTNQPEIQSDGTVTFTVADPDAHERTERLRELLGHSEEATR